jgi:mitogen-activated protein kinase kinase
MSPSIGRSVSASPGAPLPGGPPPSGQLPSGQLPSGQLPNGPFPGGVPPNFRLPQATKPTLPNFQSAPAVPNVRSAGGSKPLSMMERRGLKMAGGLPGAASPTNTTASPKRKGPSFKLSDVHGADSAAQEEPKMESMMDKFSQFIDKETGSLKLGGKAVLNAEGIKFADGASFKISLDEVETLDELGKGNYGTVYKVRHSKPRMRRPGQGLAGNKVLAEGDDSSPSAANSGTGTGIVMAMKEMRLELEEAKFATIIMELDVLHRCISPYIVDFYGAFFAEGSVYICMEFMDGGSIDKIYGNGIPENVLRKITLATVMGLKSLKDEHNIIHRDVKPTNILVNTRGQVKICDFGVSGNLVASMAKTNIGCQSYMAPERISSGGVAQAGANPGGGTYSVQSDIWSLGLTIIECALGRYPYPPETYNNIFSQLSVCIVMAVNYRSR